MGVYPTAVSEASCPSLGCACRARVPRYPSDLTDAQWAVLEPEARAAMTGLVRAAGRPMVHDLRAMLDAICYVTRYGIEWRALPADFPPHDPDHHDCRAGRGSLRMVGRRPRHRPPSNQGASRRGSTAPYAPDHDTHPRRAVRTGRDAPADLPHLPSVR